MILIARSAVAVPAQPSHLDYIDALRGYAITLVIVAHCIFVFSDLPRRVATSFLAYGGRGVQLFFIASAITLMMSWKRHRDGAAPFYLRRFFRIAPMWYLAMGYWLFEMGLAPRFYAPDGLRAWDIVLNAIFLHAWSPIAINGLVPGGWSIALEMMFYLVLPVIACVATNLHRAAAGLALSLAARALLNPLADSLVHSTNGIRISFMEYWFVNQLPVFMIGVCVYHLIERRPLSAVTASRLLVFALVSAALLPYTSVPGPTPVSYAVCWAGVAYGLANGGGNWFVNRAICFVGTISYSAYFWHLILLRNPVDLPKMVGGTPGLIRLLISTFVFTMLLSWVTYRLIERPGIRLGSFIVSARKRRRAALQAAAI